MMEFRNIAWNGSQRLDRMEDRRLPKVVYGRGNRPFGTRDVESPRPKRQDIGYCTYGEVKCLLREVKEIY